MAADAVAVSWRVMEARGQMLGAAAAVRRREAIARAVGEEAPGVVVMV
jgi:hypothetical protein